MSREKDFTRAVNIVIVLALITGVCLLIEEYLFRNTGWFVPFVSWLFSGSLVSVLTIVACIFFLCACIFYILCVRAPYGTEENGYYENTEERK